MLDKFGSIASKSDRHGHVGKEHFHLEPGLARLTCTETTQGTFTL